jgi:phosphopentomutase
MLLDQLEARGVGIYSVGKIFDVFLGRGITRQAKTKSNADGMQKTLDAMAGFPKGLVFVNLVDFDSQFGHRNDVDGYGHALEEFDRWIPSLEGAMQAKDLAIFTADHGCDPTTPSTDHSREYTPLLVFGREAKYDIDLGLRSTLSDIGQTVAENFGTSIARGESFLKELV